MPSFKTALMLAKSHPHNALAEAMAAYEQERQSTDLLTLIGELHIQLNDPATAAEYFRRATSLTPLDAAAYRRLAGAEFSAGFEAGVGNCSFCWHIICAWSCTAVIEAVGSPAGTL